MISPDEQTFLWADAYNAALSGLLARKMQGSWFSGCSDEKVDHAAWHEKPSWFVVTEKDQMINPGLQETMAKNIKATVIKANASHVVMVSQPEKTPVIG
jgi:pimeloyl-ACP methyl ester carboxylesterase